MRQKGNLLFAVFDRNPSPLMRVPNVMCRLPSVPESFNKRIIDNALGKPNLMF